MEYRDKLVLTPMVRVVTSPLDPRIQPPPFSLKPQQRPLNSSHLAPTLRRDCGSVGSSHAIAEKAEIANLIGASNYPSAKCCHVGMNYGPCITSYCNALQGTLPSRLLVAEYGADITSGEEIIDHKFLKCERVTNESIGTVDFLERGTDNVVFRTCPQERDRVIFQMGTSDAIFSLIIVFSLTRCNDVAAIDINMACPESLSLSILTTLWRNLDTTVTCKIRLRNTRQDTGVGTKVKGMPRDPAKWDEIADVVFALSIAVIATGDVFEYEDFKRIKDAAGMLA
ncbi:hypothetical protein ABZP36_003748 [Zizania latifolia]